jgi:CheY-like chemotaxis protein
VSDDGLRIVIAEDDEDDQILIRRAVETGLCPCELDFASDGEQLIERLRDAIAEDGSTPCPDIVVTCRESTASRPSGRSRTIPISARSPSSSSQRRSGPTTS